MVCIKKDILSDPKNRKENLQKSKQLMEIEIHQHHTIGITKKKKDLQRQPFYNQETPLYVWGNICPICKGYKNDDSRVCHTCYDRIRKRFVMLECPDCGEPFEKISGDYEKGLRNGQVNFYCSRVCMAKHYKLNAKIKHCPVCKGIIENNDNKYCSKTCRESIRPHKFPEKECPTCREMYQPRSKRKVYCSRICANKGHSKRMMGLGNSHFKTGTSYANWFRKMRPLIKKRDGFMCAICGKEEIIQKKTNLIIHHVDENPQNNVAENLITLCEQCHARHHHSSQTPYKALDIMAQERTKSMSNELRELTTSLQMEYSITDS